MKLLFLLPLLLLTSCAAYNKTVSAREVSVSGYGKDEGGYGGQAKYRVEYR